MVSKDTESLAGKVKTGDVDLSHHLSKLSKSRQRSPLKEIVKYMGEPGMVSLAGGLPHASLFPYASLSGEIFRSDTFVDPDDPTPPSLERISLHRDGPATANTLSKAMQYTAGTGDIELTKVCAQFVRDVFKPARADSQVLLHMGNTDAWAKVVSLLCEPGEHVLVEEFVYPSAQHFYIPLGCKGVPIAMDGDGLIPASLDDILTTWEETHPGARKPHILYTVPVGQNPCGTTLTWERKKEIYALAVKHDLIIVEDDPYYWLQLPPYFLPEERARLNGSAPALELVPPFIHLDTDGRVIRLDTFSKTISPGSRLGFFVANPMFAERLLRATEVTTQAPSGFSQAITLELLNTWGQDGYLKWLSNLKDSYTKRRNWMCDALAEQFDLRIAEPSSDGLACFIRGNASEDAASGIAAGKPAFSFVPPKGGMFVWAKLHLANSSTYRDMKSSTVLNEHDAIAKWSGDFWHALIKNKVLLTPGSYYTPWEGEGIQRVNQPDTAYFRLAFSYETREAIELGIKRMAEVFGQHFA